MKRAINSSEAGRRLYSQKDVNAILEQANGKSFTDENLEEMAKELGISPAQLKAAKELWFNEQQKLIELEELKTKHLKMKIDAILSITVIISFALIFSLMISNSPF